SWGIVDARAQVEDMEQILAYRVVSTMGRFLEYKNADPVVGRFSPRNPLRVLQSGNRRGEREKARLRTRLTPTTETEGEPGERLGSVIVRVEFIDADAVVGGDREP